MIKSSINKIYLHIGLNKTASSSIQASLKCSMELLRNEGYLYPNFDDILESTNHNYPLLNYCSLQPENIVQNLKFGINQPDFASSNKTRFIDSLKTQLEQFTGENLIFSAEQIHTLARPALSNLKSLINNISQHDCEIEIIAFVRHPVTFAQSVIQQGVKTGFNILNKQVQVSIASASNFNMKVLRKFIDCFGQTTLKVFRFEDAIQHPYGPVGMFLSIVGFPEDKIGLITQLRINESISAEAIFLLSAINEYFPNVVDNEWNFVKEKLPLVQIINMKGQKFSLSCEDQHKIWNASQFDRAWLVQEFNIKPFESSFENVAETNYLWGIETLQQLKGIVPYLPDELKKIVAQVLESEILRSDKKITDDSKKLMEEQIKNMYDTLSIQSEKPVRRLILINHTNFKGYFENELSNPLECMISAGMFEIHPVNGSFALTLPRVMRSFESNTFVIMKLDSTVQSTLTLEFQTISSTDFASSNSLRQEINGGMHKVEFRIPDFDFNGKSRLIFHDSEAVYKIQKIEIQTDAPSYENLFKENERMRKQIELLEQAKKDEESCEDKKDYGKMIKNWVLKNHLFKRRYK